MTQGPIYRADADLADEPRAEASFLRMQPRYLAIPASGLHPINLNLSVVVTIVLAAVPRIRALRADLEKLPDFDACHVDDLEDEALGLDYVLGRVAAAVPPRDDLPDLYREATQQRDLAVMDLRNLSAHGLIDASTLRSIRGGLGHQRVMEDLRSCLAVYEAVWPGLAAKSCCTRDDLDRCHAVLHRMQRLVGDRRCGSVRIDEWTDLRSRAFSLLFDDYAQTRKAVRYVRGARGDADSIAPSLFKARMKRHRAKAEGGELDAPQPQAQPTPPQGGAPQPEHQATTVH